MYGKQSSGDFSRHGVNPSAPKSFVPEFVSSLTTPHVSYNDGRSGSYGRCNVRVSRRTGLPSTSCPSRVLSKQRFFYLGHIFYEDFHNSPLNGETNSQTPTQTYLHYRYYLCTFGVLLLRTLGLATYSSLCSSIW